ncbi:hypothetical protein SIM91_02900 [Rhodococcus opacus]|uniref:hypothetical protein n=1 Tax=Rhodococcus opacus TaxID=37919 RepID=UPI0007CD5C9B|nr:hypothetical protein [Rhodococcus opacus]MDX5962291.1 hypothetical protein [Rhodococcus opacus]NKY74817.1 hypothetical protein [Rhodococcus opacus]CAG7641667.1 hypothetical protein E143388_08307 [Rhodococcus opacus]
MAEGKRAEKSVLPAVAVGARVRVRRRAEPAVTGEVVADYAELTDTEERGHDWAPVRRWAVALDDGRLVFADTADLIVEPGTRKSGPGANPNG